MELSLSENAMTMTMLDQAAVTADPGRVDEGRRPDPEVPERARRRTFTAAYKAQILAAYEAAGQGEKGALLRREGLYSSHIVDWRRTPGAAATTGAAAAPGRPRSEPRDAQIARLMREKAHQERDLATSRFVVEVLMVKTPA